MKRQYDKEFKVQTVKHIWNKASLLLRLHGNWIFPPIRCMDGSSNISNSEEAFVGTGNLRSGDQAARDLQKRILDLEEENAILKKVMHIFAKDRR